MKLGIVGTGMIVNDLLANCKKANGINYVAITGTTSGEEKLKRMCETYKIPNYFVEIEDMLKSDLIDTVYVALPNHLHYKICKLALQNNKHVICEKPFTSNLKELEKLVEIAKNKNLLLFEAVSTHYLPNTIEIKNNLDKVGDLKLIIANYSQYSSRYNDFKKGIIQPAFDPKKSGGALMDLNIYNINLMVNLFGKPLDVQYYANIEKGIDTSGILVLDYGSFKAVCVGAKDCRAPINTTIQGDKGFISITTPANVINGFKVEELIENGMNKNCDYNDGEHRMYYEFIEFERAIREKDYDFANKMLEISLAVMDIQTKARKTAGIVFAND